MELDEAAETLEVAGQLLDLAIPAYVAQVRQNGTDTDVLAAIDAGDGYELIYEILDVVQEQGTPGPNRCAADPLYDALFAVANERIGSIAVSLLAEALRAAYAAATPYQFCNHDDYPATCVTCLANARIAVENNTPEWVADRIAGRPR